LLLRRQRVGGGLNFSKRAHGENVAGSRWINERGFTTSGSFEHGQHLLSSGVESKLGIARDGYTPHFSRHHGPVKTPRLVRRSVVGKLHHPVAVAIALTIPFPAKQTFKGPAANKHGEGMSCCLDTRFATLKQSWQFVVIRGSSHYWQTLRPCLEKSGGLPLE
jgi:hypothetical protein